MSAVPPGPDAVEAWPSSLQINAWAGDRVVEGGVSPAAPDWALRSHIVPAPQYLFADEAPDLRDWRDERVGWGLVLADPVDDEGVDPADRAAGLDAPEPIQRLLQARDGAPVFRYREDLGVEYLRRYFTDAPPQDISLFGAGERGVGRGELPWYLLICGPPTSVPWALQFVLNPVAFVGRLHLDETGLQRYVDALLADWNGAAARVEQPVVWAVDHHPDDITWLMRHAIAEPLTACFSDDEHLRAGARHLGGADATVRGLSDALADARPGLVVSTSHGATGPLDDPARMGRDLGLPVDQQHALARPEDLLVRWQPDGAIWYAHACCSAGGDAQTHYVDLVDAGSSIERTLAGVAALGARTAPLPVALLGAERPLRAFVGQVEPTFNWTVRHPGNREVLTAGIRRALYEGMYRRQPLPVGLAVRSCFEPIGGLWSQWRQAQRKAGAGDRRARDTALRTQLMALDRQSTVVLGDPTACLPALQP